MLAILCDFQEEEAKDVLDKIIKRLQTLSQDSIKLQKYIRQILLLSRLRNLTALITKQLKDMALVYDIEKDALYQEGEQLGLQKGEFQKTIKGIRRALEKGKFTLEEIADLFEVSLDFVLKVQNGEIA